MILGPVGHCTSRFKRAVCISCGRMWTRGVKSLIFCGRHKWMAPKNDIVFSLREGKETEPLFHILKIRHESHFSQYLEL